MKKKRSLEELKDWSVSENIAIVGGGPSLDQCENEIESLIAEGTLFLLTDIISAKFIKKYPSSRRLIFTVENRSHGYLRQLQEEKIAIYIKSRQSNVNKKNYLYQFHFDFDNHITADSFKMKSAGTVAGPAVYWALYLALTTRKVNNIFLFGIDLCYLDNQIYSRFCLASGYNNYFSNRETNEYIGILKRSSRSFVINEMLIRTSFEFETARQNLGILLGKYKDSVNILNYSPLGVDNDSAKKVIPKKILTELSGT